jgi:hypothetical protein
MAVFLNKNFPQDGHCFSTRVSQLGEGDRVGDVDWVGVGGAGTLGGGTCECKGCMLDLVDYVTTGDGG